MRKFGLMLIAVTMGLSLSAGNASAFGIDIFSTVNPYYENKWDEDTLSGTALYTIEVLPFSMYGANVFAVTFENDIFASVANALLIAPPGWTITDATGPTGYKYEVALGGSDLLEPGETPKVSFSVDYTLFSLAQFSYASGLGWAWDEGQAWAQSVSATNTIDQLPTYLGGGNPSGGNSTTPVPEPATMILLGSGLLGLAALGRRKRS